MRRVSLLLCAVSTVATAQLVRPGLSVGIVPQPGFAWVPRLDYGGTRLISDNLVLAKGDQSVVAELGEEPVLSGRRIYCRTINGFDVFDAASYVRIASVPSQLYGNIAAASKGGRRVAYAGYAYDEPVPTIGQVVLVNGTSGNAVNTFNPSKRSSQIIGGTRIFVTAGPEVRDLNGELLWRDRIGGEIALAPDEKSVVSLSGGWLVTSDVATGTRLWQRPTAAVERTGVQVDKSSSVVYVLEPYPGGFGNSIAGFRMSDGSRLPTTAPAEASRILDIALGTNELLVDPNGPDDMLQAPLRTVRVAGDGSLVSDEPFGTKPYPGVPLMVNGQPRFARFDADRRCLVVLDAINGNQATNIQLNRTTYAGKSVVPVGLTDDGEAALVTSTDVSGTSLDLVSLVTGRRLSSFSFSRDARIVAKGDYYWVTNSFGQGTTVYRYLAEDGRLIVSYKSTGSNTRYVPVFRRLGSVVNDFNGSTSSRIVDVVTGRIAFSGTGLLAEASNGAFVEKVGSSYNLYRIYSLSDIRLLASGLTDAEVSGKLSNDGRRFYRNLSGYFDVVTRNFVSSGYAKFFGDGYFDDPRYQYATFSGHGIAAFAYR